MASFSLPVNTSRRRFLAGMLKGVLAIAGAVLIHPLIRFSGYTVKPKPRHIVIHKPLPVGGLITERDFILFMLDSGPLAVSRICTHLGCRVNFRKELNLIECPCHQSQFTPTGIRVAGPAQRNLPTFPVKTLKDDQGMTTGYRVTL